MTEKTSKVIAEIGYRYHEKIEEKRLRSAISIFKIVIFYKSVKGINNPFMPTQGRSLYSIIVFRLFNTILDYFQSRNNCYFIFSLRSMDPIKL